MTCAVPDADPLAGLVIAERYAIRQRIGRGGMGAVYLARQEPLGRDVALKVIRADLVGDTEIGARFEREARAIARLSDPHIVVVHDFGQSHGHLYLAMELLKGRTLGDLLREHSFLSLRDALQITRDVCAALDVAHGSGVIHRDLKPDNIMLVHTDGRDTFAKVLDFGIAKIAGGVDGVQTSARVVLGTPGYVAPEVIMGGMGEDPRADLYAVGVMLFEMLAGASPFSATSPSALLVTQASHDAPVLSTRAAVPSEVSDLVARLMARAPEHRPGSARDVIALIDQLDPTPAPLRGGSSTTVMAGSVAATTMPLSVLAGRVATRSETTARTASTPAGVTVLTPTPTTTSATTSMHLARGRLMTLIGGAAVVVGLFGISGWGDTPAPAPPAPPAPTAMTGASAGSPPTPAPPSLVTPAAEPVALEAPPPLVTPAAEPVALEVPPPPAQPAPSAAPRVASRPRPKAPPSPALVLAPPPPAAPTPPALPSLSSALIKQGIVDSVGKAAACTNTNIKLAPSGPGLLVDHCPSYRTVDDAAQVALTVSPTGEVLSARFTDPALNAHRLGTCILESFKGWRFPAFLGDAPVVIQQRVVFEACVPINGVCIF